MHTGARHNRPHGVPGALMYTSIDTDIIEPVNLEGLKAYLSLREDSTSDDSYLEQLITSARSRLEEEGGLERVIAMRPFETIIADDQYWHDLYRPLVSIDEVKYTDATGTVRHVEDYDYAIGNSAGIGFIPPQDIKAGTGVTVRYTSGYEQYPPSIILAIKMMCKSMYSRESGDPLSDEVRKLIGSEVIYVL